LHLAGLCLRVFTFSYICIFACECCYINFFHFLISRFIYILYRMSYFYDSIYDCMISNLIFICKQNRNSTTFVWNVCIIIFKSFKIDNIYIESRFLKADMFRLLFLYPYLYVSFQLRHNTSKLFFFFLHVKFNNSVKNYHRINFKLKSLKNILYK